MSKYLIGSDPEMFIKDKTGKIRSGIGIFNGTKDKPIDIGNGCAIQEDNILVEFNIPPTNNLSNFLDSISYSKEYIKTLLIPLDFELHYSSSERIEANILEDERTQIFGCSPSYNVVTQDMSVANFEFLTESERLIRSSGFHIHIGYENPTEEFSERLVLCFELFVTLSLLKLDNDKYNRRMLYGLVGDARMKPYGVECRSLGGYFLKDEKLLTLVWERTMKAIDFEENSFISTKKLI